MKDYDFPRKTNLIESDSEDITCLIKKGGSTFKELLAETNLTKTELENILEQLLKEGSIIFEDGLYKTNKDETEDKIVNSLETPPDEFEVEIFIGKKGISFEKLMQLMNLERSDLEKILKKLEEEGRIKYENNLIRQVTPSEILKKYGIPIKNYIQFVGGEKEYITAEAVEFVISKQPNGVSFVDLQGFFIAEVRDLDAKLEKLLSEGKIKYENGLFLLSSC
ncbi:hypothetical protein [Candidatus Absconditicoccus praedator]|uniref:hypothetical protein n=1 Tax=Candidatus Absconditicoccus praedator TaxID=2735562 RepID=UPI001E5300CF|nr:hypothetical protein [Candidatus Absconditicoccus praedator]UFX83066.1 hypothetical protein HLG78_02930 [Candidatus Absconditicoccus praedator]